jgi:hypothetical protein
MECLKWYVGKVTEFHIPLRSQLKDNKYWRKRHLLCMQNKISTNFNNKTNKICTKTICKMTSVVDFTKSCKSKISRKCEFQPIKSLEITLTITLTINLRLKTFCEIDPWPLNNTIIKHYHCMSQPM